MSRKERKEQVSVRRLEMVKKFIRDYEANGMESAETLYKLWVKETPQEAQLVREAWTRFLESAYRVHQEKVA